MSYSAADFQSDVLAHFKAHSLIHPPDGVDEIPSDEAYDAVVAGLDKLVTERDNLKSAAKDAATMLADLHKSYPIKELHMPIDELIEKLERLTEEM